jgi:hypothetical protein
MITMAQREPEIESDRLLDDLRWKPVRFVVIFVIPLATEPPEGPQAQTAGTRIGKSEMRQLSALGAGHGL